MNKSLPIALRLSPVFGPCKWILIMILTVTLTGQAQITEEIRKSFVDPPVDCWPHTRWWWPGNSVSKEEITWQLEQMRSHGIRGVEQISMGQVYEKGNIAYASDEYFEMAAHVVAEAKRLGMEVSFNFGGPGWIMSGNWVPEEDKLKDMIPTSVLVEGPGLFDDLLPAKLTKTQRSWELYRPQLDGDEKLIAVVAGKVEDGRILESSLQVITELTAGHRLHWQIPEGEWRIMAFWLKTNGHDNAVDHYNLHAMERFCNHLGDKYKAAVGDEFGKTVVSFFGDSFELPNLASGIYWSTGLMEKFRETYGYDLAPYLPAVWWEVGEISPKIRHDINEFLHKTGMEAWFGTFMGWCEKNGVQGRVQTYGFPTDNIQAAGATHIPEMEITAGEKDAQEWFDTRIGPKKYVASGAHLYGRPVVSVEAYTFIHWERYRATLEELKIASDIYLKNGATKFYNHGFTYSPEREVAPSRSTPWAAYIHPNNVWWKYYPKLAEFIARSSWLLRQGDFAPDIAIYSPLANQWTKDALNPRKWTREFDWGELGKLVISNGYDYDLLNDDALQNLATVDNGNIRIRNMEYKVLILPNVESMPLASLKFIEDYVQKGGTVIALERVPEYSTGLNEYAEQDAELRQIAERLFGTPSGRDAVAHHPFGSGQTYHIKTVLDRSIWWDKRSSTLDPFVNTLRKHIAPDLGIDFAFEGMRRNEGLTFQHRKLGETDIYFVTNVQDQAVDMPVTLRTTNGMVEKWDPYTGETGTVCEFKVGNDAIEIPLKLKPWESTFYIFSPGLPGEVVSQSDFRAVQCTEPGVLQAVAGSNGTHRLQVNNRNGQTDREINVSGIPAPLTINGEWEMILESKHFPKVARKVTNLDSWTNDTLLRHFSGTGHYAIEFNLGREYLQNNMQLMLDLGKVGEVAEVAVNAESTGVVWMKGHKLDITDQVRSGRNTLEIAVTNTLINQVSAYTEPVPVPEELVSHFGSVPTQSPGHLPREFGFEPLPASGLLGPVRIIPLKKILISMD